MAPSVLLVLALPETQSLNQSQSDELLVASTMDGKSGGCAGNEVPDLLVFAESRIF